MFYGPENTVKVISNRLVNLLTLFLDSLNPLGGKPVLVHIQYNLNGSNPDGLFTLDDSNSFFQSLQNPSNSSRKQIFRNLFSYFIMEWYVVCTHWNRPIEAIQMSTLNIQLLCRKSRKIPSIIAICFLTWHHN